MKKSSIRVLFLLSVALGFSAVAGAQDGDGKAEKSPKEKGFKKDHLFTGGSVSASFGSGQTNFGIGPYFGYSLNRYLDVAVSLNYNYVSQRDNIEYGDKIRQSVIAPGLFLRAYPVKFLFAHAQFEYNFIKLKYIPAQNGSYLPQTENYSAPSFLIGPGLATGRDEGGTWGYISLLFDVEGDKQSPYVDDLGRTEPVIRAGLNVPLFQGSSGSGRYRKRSRF